MAPTASVWQSKPPPYSSITGIRERRWQAPKRPEPTKIVLDGSGKPGLVFETVFCDKCNKEGLVVTYKRCSVCKQRHYCSQECQTKDWTGSDGHKICCSPEPKNLAATVAKPGPLLVDTIKKLGAVVFEVLQAWEVENFSCTALVVYSSTHLFLTSKREGISDVENWRLWEKRSNVPEMKEVIEFEYPEKYRYVVNPSVAKTLGPMRLATIRATRVFMIYELSIYPAEDREVHERLMANTHRKFGGRNVPRFDMAKWFAVPLTLSPGEYEALPPVIRALYEATILHEPDNPRRQKDFEAATLRIAPIQRLYDGLYKSCKNVGRQILKEVSPELSAKFEAKLKHDTESNYGLVTPSGASFDDQLKMIEALAPDERRQAKERMLELAVIGFRDLAKTADQGVSEEEMRRAFGELIGLQ